MTPQVELILNIPLIVRNIEYVGRSIKEVEPPYDADIDIARGVGNSPAGSVYLENPANAIRPFPNQHPISNDPT